MLRGNRSVRHVKLPTDGYRQAQQEQVIYANDMTEGDEATLVAVGVSPAWRLDNGADMNVYADLKLPIDRVPGTPLLLKLVYASVVGGGNFLFYIKFLVASLGTLLTTATSAMFAVGVGSPPNIQNVAPTFTLQAPELDGLIEPIDLQLNIGREGAHALDTSTQNVNIVKLIVEYTAYV